MTTSHPMPIDAKNVNQIWKNNFNITNSNNNNNNNNNNMNNGTKMAEMKEVKTTWACLNNNNNQLVNHDLNVCLTEEKNDSDDSNSGSNNCKIVEVEKLSNDDANDNMDANDTNASPSHHARRPMNAFLIFCKKHRPIVRKIFPTLENRGVTRILGEWWSLLDLKDKDPYTKLAKQYKDAFFNANPDFKWYKLPAPPLRTLPTRPTKVETSPPVSPVSISSKEANIVVNCTTSATPSGDFTPGKLADETQLGMLSSLFTASYSPKANDSENSTTTTPSSQSDHIDVSDPPKPFKKRIVDLDVKHQQKLVRNLFEETENQDFVSIDEQDVGSNGRKSYRKGKGNRYADIMANGKLIKNKRASTDKLPNDAGQNQSQPAGNSNQLELKSTIKKLQDRLLTNTVVKNDTNVSENNLDGAVVALHNQEAELDKRVRTISEISEMSDIADFSKAVPSFDLDARISELPNLSYDTYVQRKKEMKKRKVPKGNTKAQKQKKNPAGNQNNEVKNQKRTYTDAELDKKSPVVNVNGKVRLNNAVEKQTGSKKRKNKHNITHLKNNTAVNAFENDMSGLNTLAEIASNLSNNNNNEIGFGEKIV